MSGLSSSVLSAFPAGTERSNLVSTLLREFVWCSEGSPAVACGLRCGCLLRRLGCSAATATAAGRRSEHDHDEDCDDSRTAIHDRLRSLPTAENYGCGDPNGFRARYAKPLSHLVSLRGWDNVGSGLFGGQWFTRLPGFWLGAIWERRCAHLRLSRQATKLDTLAAYPRATQRPCCDQRAR